MHALKGVSELSTANGLNKELGLNIQHFCRLEKSNRYVFFEMPFQVLFFILSFVLHVQVLSVLLIEAQDPLYQMSYSVEDILYPLYLHLIVRL